MSGHTATARDPGVCAAAVADGLGRLPAIERCWHDRDGPASCCGPAPDSRFHGLQHSSVCSIFLSWQHRSPSEREVLHLELELRLGFLGSVLLNSILPDWMIGILAAGSLLLVVGVIDDVWELPASSKLVAQLAAAGIVIATGKALTLFPSGPVGDVANVLLTLLWIVGITNAFNFFDGMDGLATGLAILIAGFMAAVAFETNQSGLGWLAIAIIGAGVGFLPCNFRGRKPAVIFLGDGGAT